MRIETQQKKVADINSQFVDTIDVYPGGFDRDSHFVTGPYRGVTREGHGEGTRILFEAGQLFFRQVA